MTQRYLSLLPAPGSPARLPASLVPVLIGLAVVQLVLPGALSLPQVGPPARLVERPLPSEPGTVIIPARLTVSTLFSPRSGSGSGDSGIAAAPDPLDGATIAGTLRRGGKIVAIVQLGDRSVRYVPRGGTIAGWRLIALEPGLARLTRGAGESLTVPYGTHAAARSSSLSNSTADEEQ